MAKILVVEDESTVQALLKTLLLLAGHRVRLAACGREGLEAFDQDPPDLVILDVGLPDLDGWRLLAEVRRTSRVPILMLTGLNTEADKVRGLRGGADDYLAKPFGQDELVARVDALLRRAGLVRPATIDDGLTAIDFDRRSVSINGRSIPVTRGEFELLSTLVRDPGVVRSPSQLVEDGWDEDRSDAYRAKAAIHRLRKKLAAAGIPDYPIEAVRGVGYRYAGPLQARRHFP